MKIYGLKNKLAIKKHFLERLETILPTTVKAEDVEQPSQIRRI